MASIITPKIRAYRDFLTPAFHRRFTHASLLVLAFCWLEASLMSSSGFFWSWFPLGFTGIRTLLLFCPCLGIFIVRLSSLHFGKRTTTSGYETFHQLILSPKTAITLLWHLYSAIFFGEVYIWSRGYGANLAGVDYGRAYERPRLNENPVILRSFFVLLAFLQTTLHLYKDYDRVDLSEKEERSQFSKTGMGSKLPGSILKLAENAAPITKNTVNLTIAALVCITPIYFGLIRRFAWPWAYFFGKLFAQQLPRKATPPGLTHVAGLVWQATTSSLMLSLLWEISNQSFNIFVSKPPLKKEMPLTSEIKDNAGVVISRSSDPNGSLITGLRSKKEGPRTYAFWELYLICAQFETRRKSIFTEVDRDGGSTWVQISSCCVQEIEAIFTRIKRFQEPADPKSAPAQAVQTPNTQGAQGAVGLPKIANQTVQQGDVLTKNKPDFAQSVSKVARSLGESPGARNPIVPPARKALEWGAQNVLTREQQSQLSRQGISKEASQRMLQILRTPLGEPFRETFDRTVSAVVCSAPFSAHTNIVHAARALSMLLKASLREDTCGIVAKDVPQIVRVFTSAITSVRNFVDTLQPSWTDVDFNAKGRKVEDVELIIAELQDGLEGILLAFAEYSSGLGLSKKELREAKEAVGRQRHNQV